MEGTAFRLLVIEDSKEDFQLLHRALLRVNMEHQLTHLADGAEALRFIERDGKYAGAPVPDLVLLDIGLPKTNGIEVLRALRDSLHLRDVPVIITSSLPSQPNRVPLEELGAEMYWTKPDTPEGFDDLAESIKAIAAGLPTDRSAS